MSDEILQILCVLGILLVAVTVIGHSIWVLVAAIFRAITGSNHAAAATAGRPCPKCGARSSVHAGRCIACGAVPEVMPGESQREDLRGTARQLWRMLEQGRITQRQYDELMFHVRADLARHGIAPPSVSPLPLGEGRGEGASTAAAAIEAEVIDAVLVEPSSSFLAGTTPTAFLGPGEFPPVAQPPREEGLRGLTPPARQEARSTAEAARQEPRPPTRHPLDRPPPIATQPIPPAKPARSLADMLQSFMEESNVRWGEIIAAILIVICSIGLVISIQATYDIPYFPAFVFTLFTVSFHGAGLYTLRRWNLQAVSRVILIISLLLVPLTFSAAVVMSGSGQAQRPATDPLFLLVLGVGTLVFAWVSWSASRELVREGAWRLAVGVLGTSLAQVLIQRTNLAGASFWLLNGIAAVPLACFLVPTIGQLLRARAWPRLSRGRANQIFLVLGVATFAFAAPIALLLVRAEPRWQAVSWLSPLLSLAAAAVLALGLLIHRRTTARLLAAVQTAGTALLICGGILMLVLVGFTWPQPELLCAVGLLNAVVLLSLATASRLPLLHAPAIACTALAAVIGLHLAQGRFDDRDGLSRQIIEAVLMARSSLVLTVLAAVVGVIGLWQHRERREEWLVSLGSAGALAALSIAIAGIAGFLPIPGWQQDADLAGPMLLLYALAFIATSQFVPLPGIAGVGSFLLWAGLVQSLRFNSTIRGALDSQGLLPERPVLVATLVHAISTALLAAVAAGRQLIAPAGDFRQFERSPRGERLILPLAAGAVVSLVLSLPMILWFWYESSAAHAGYAIVAAIAWGAVALAMRWKWAVSGLQSMLFVAPALLAAGAWMKLDDPNWPLSPGHVQAQLVLLAGGAIGWSLVRRLSSGNDLARDLLHAEWPTVDQMLLILVSLLLPLWTLVLALPTIRWELGFDAVAAGGLLPVNPLTLLDGGGWIVLAAVLLAVIASLWERITPAGLAMLGIASFAAVWLVGLQGNDSVAVATASRWAAGSFAILWALPFILRNPLDAAARRVTWLRWDQLPRELSQWFCAQPLLLGGTAVLTITLVAVAQSAGGAALRGPAEGSIFHAMGPTAAYAVPLLALVAVLLAYAVRERQAAFALGGSAVFQLAVNLAFILHVTTAATTLPQTVRAIEWLQWNATAAGLYALVWLALGRWINGEREASVGEREASASRWFGIWTMSSETHRGAYAPRSPADLMLWLQIAVGTVLTFALLVWSVLAVAVNPRTLLLETSQLGHWLSYFALTVVLVAFGWHTRGRLKSGWGDIAIWFAAGLVALAACSLDATDTGRTWLAYHVLTGGWMAIGTITAATVVYLSLAGTKPGPGSAALASSSNLPGASLLPAKVTLFPHHFTAATLAAFIALLAVRGATTDPGEPWWSTAASLAAFAIATALGLARRSQAYAYASVTLAGLTVFLLLIAPSVATHMPAIFGRPPWASLDLVVIAALAAAGLWLAAEVRRQFRASESLDLHWPLPRVHAFTLLGWLAVLIPWQLLLLSLREFETPAAIAVAITDVALLGALFVTTLWDRRAWWSLPALFAWGGVAWILAVHLVSNRVAAEGPEILALLGLAAALHIALAGQIWSYGANLAVVGTRLGISDPIGGLKRTELWLPPLSLTITAVVSVVHLFFVLGLNRVEYRVAAAWAPAIAAWGVLCLAQERRRDALQLTSLLLAALSAVYLGWAQLDPSEATETWGLSRAFRLLMVLAAVTFAYGLVLPRWLLTDGSWNAAVRKAGYGAGAAAVATFIGVLVLEVMLFTPGQDAPIDGVQVAAIAVVLLGLIAGLLSLALLPGRDPLALTEQGRQWYVYAAEAVAALLFAHLYICRPTWFDTALRPYWPLIVMGIAFAGVGAAEICQRLKIRVLAEPLARTGALLPLLPVLGWWIVGPRTDYALLLFVVGLLYLVLSVTRKSWASLIAAVVAGNGALWALWHDSQFNLQTHPQLWLIPPALSVLLASQINKHRLPPATLAAIRYSATIVIYLSSTSEIFIRGVGNSLWPPMILATLAIAGALLGIMLRIRAFLYLGTTFTLLALGTMVAHAAQAIEHVWPWWAFGIGSGIALLALLAFFEKNKTEMLALVGRLRSWEQ